MPKRLLILDDDLVRLHGFEEIAPRLGTDWAIRTWRDAHSMILELQENVQEAHLISLDHDLYKDSPSDPDPGTGRAVADYLAKCASPICPVIVHSTNTDAAWGMFNELSSRGWKVSLVHHLNQSGWIEKHWLPVAKNLIASIGIKEEAIHRANEAG